MEIVRSLIRKIVCWAMPDIKILINQSYHFDWLRSHQNNLVKEESAMLYEPFNVFNSKIGRYTYISINSRISNTTIGNFCSVGPNFLCGWGIHPTDFISTHPMFYSTLKQNGMSLSSEDKITERMPITIGNDVFIGANVTILDGVTIGDGAIIGAGAVVSKDIPPYAVAVGCPIQIMRYRFTEEQREELLKIKWWLLSEQQLKLVEQYDDDIDGFIKIMKEKCS